MLRMATADENYRSISSYGVNVSTSSTDTMVQDLPIEVLVHIFEYLSLSDRIASSQVCIAWNEASRDVQFINKEIVCLHDGLYRPLEVLSDSNFRIWHLMLKEVELSGSSVEAFLQKYCPSLKSLSIVNCDISCGRFVDILKLSSSIELLRVISCRELLISQHFLAVPSDILFLSSTLVNLKELDLESNRYLSDALFNRFVSIVPNLETLSLSRCQISFHMGLYKKFYPFETAAVASESVLTFPNILQYIIAQASKIKHLRFGRTHLDNSALHDLAQVPNLNLESFDAQDCYQLSNKGILSFALGQKSVTKLDLSSCLHIVDDSVLAICSSMKNLTSLSLVKCRNLTNTSIAQLRQLKQLVELDLSYCDSVTSEGIQAALCSSVNTSFRHLVLAAINLDENIVCQLTVSLPCLVRLDLSWCFNAVTDKSIQTVCRTLIWLTSLKLAGCDKLTDAGLTGMGMGLVSPQDQENTAASVQAANNKLSGSEGETVPKVGLAAVRQQQSISLRSRAEQDIVNDAKRKEIVSLMCEDQFLKLTGSGYALSSVKGLQELDLKGCNRITDVSLKYAFYFQELRFLNIGQCQQISKEGVSYLAANNPSIETLEMSQCYNITDDCVSTIARSLLRLKHLDLQNCNQLTDQSLLAIGRHCLRLQYLNVSSCHGMSLEEAENLEQRVPSLHTVNHQGVSLKWQIHDPDEPPKKPKSAPKPPPLFGFLRKRFS